MLTETVSLKDDLRQKAGSNQARRLRREGKLPAVVYGHGKEPLSIAVNAHDFVQELHRGHRLFTVDLGGKAETLLLKDVQYDYLGKNPLHIDLIRVDLTERVVVAIPLEFRGVAKGTTMGGILDEVMTQLEIECGVTEIPEVIPVIVRDLGLNEALHAKDIELPAGCTLKTDPEALVLICHETKAAVAAEEAAEGQAAQGAVEPEVITERKKEEQAE